MTMEEQNKDFLQFTCPECQMHRFQFLDVIDQSKEFVVKLICMSCGLQQQIILERSLSVNLSLETVTPKRTTRSIKNK